MMKKALPVLALAIALPLTANAGGLFGKKTAAPEKVLTATADALGYDEEDITISDMEKGEGAETRYKATLKDGSVYRCYIETSGGLVKVLSFGQGFTSDAQCVKKVGTGTDASPKKSRNALLEAAGKE